MIWKKSNFKYMWTIQLMQMILLGTNSSTIHILTMLVHYLYGKYKHYNMFQLHVISEIAMDNSCISMSPNLTYNYELNCKPRNPDHGANAFCWLECLL